MYGGVAPRFRYILPRGLDRNARSSPCAASDGYPTFPAVDSSRGVNQENRNTPKWDILESSDICVIVGRPLVRATATDRLGFTTRTKLDFQFPIFVETSLGVDEAHLLFNAIQDSL